MDTSKDKIRKRDIVKHGIDKAASKLGLSSHSQAGSSHLFDAIAPSITSALSMTPAMSQAQKDALYPTPPPKPDVMNQEETRYRAPATPASTGDKNQAIGSRLNSVSLPKKKIHDDKKNSNKLQDNKTGGTQSGNK